LYAIWKDGNYLAARKGFIERRLERRKLIRGYQMKLKTDENGQVVVEDGKPIYIHDDGKEIPFDAKAAFIKIKEQGTENKTWREKYQALETKLEPFQDLDPEVARKALATVKNLEDKQLIDAGEVETVKKNLAASYEENLNNTKKSYEQKMQELNGKLDQQNNNIEELLLLGAFERSPFIREKTNLTPDIAYASFKKGLQVEYDKEGKPHVVGYVDGEKLFSRKDPGKLADPEEAIEMIINAYPYKDRILRGSGQGGSGGGPGGGADDPNDLQAQLVKATKEGNVNKMISLKRQIAQQAKR
jgi:hypothetical protein